MKSQIARSVNVGCVEGRTLLEAAVAATTGRKWVDVYVCQEISHPGTDSVSLNGGVAT
jgi:hypothetical protein